MFQFLQKNYNWKMEKALMENTNSIENKQRAQNKTFENDGEFKNNYNKSTQPLAIKTFQSKFIFYLNQLNAGIQNCKRKRKGVYDDKKKSVPSTDPQSNTMIDEQCSRASRKSNRSSMQKRRSISKQYNIIQGERTNGKIHGKAILQFQNGAIFKGDVQEGDIKEGHISFPDGSQYEGGFKNFLFHGEGRLKLFNNTQYKSTFNNGAMSKKGEIYYNNGDIYIGEITNYKKHGEGQLKLKNGNKYIGNFEEGQITGFGTYYVNQNVAAKGTWSKGQFLHKSSPIGKS